MPIYGYNHISQETTAGSHYIIGQQGRTDTPGTAVTITNALAQNPLAFDASDNLFIPLVYRYNTNGVTLDTAILESETIGSSVDRQQGQSGRTSARGNLVLPSSFQGLEPFFQDVANTLVPRQVTSGATTQSLGTGLAIVANTALVITGTYTGTATIRIVLSGAPSASTDFVITDGTNSETLTFGTSDTTMTSTTRFNRTGLTITPDRADTATASVTANVGGTTANTFEPSNAILPGLTAESVKGSIPNRITGMKVDSMEMELSADRLTNLSMGMVGINYENNHSLTAEYSPGSGSYPNNAPANVPTTLSANTSLFSELPRDQFVGYSAGLFFTVGGTEYPLGPVDARFSIRNNYQPGNNLLGGLNVATADARKVGNFTRGQNFREVDFNATIPYSYQNADLVTYFLENQTIVDLSLQLRFDRSGVTVGSLRVNFARAQFARAADPEVSGGGDINAPLELRMLPSTPGANDVFEFVYTVPASAAVTLQSYQE